MRWWARWFRLHADDHTALFRAGKMVEQQPRVLSQLFPHSICYDTSPGLCCRAVCVGTPEPGSGVWEEVQEVELKLPGCYKRRCAVLVQGRRRQRCLSALGCCFGFLCTAQPWRSPMGNYIFPIAHRGFLPLTEIIEALIRARWEQWGTFHWLPNICLLWAAPGTLGSPWFPTHWNLLSFGHCRAVQDSSKYF